MAKVTNARGRGKKEPDLDLIGLESGRKPPQAPDIEEAVLGALLLEPEAINDVRDTLVPECFYRSENRKVFLAISALAARHAAIDIYTVAEELAKKGELEEVGGNVYLSRLSMKIGAAAHLEYHTTILVTKGIDFYVLSGDKRLL